MSLIAGIIHYGNKPEKALKTSVLYQAREYGKMPVGGAVTECQTAPVFFTSAYSEDRDVCVESESGNLIAANARIDNSDVLTTQLRLRNDASAAEVILAAYEKWGEACIDQLIGDFSFAVWDAAKQQLVCGRDHSGVRPFYYYYEAGQCFAFASDINALFEIADIDRRPDEAKIGLYLCWLTDHREYSERTFYQNVCALKPAHVLVAAEHILHIERYWNLHLGRFKNLNTDEEYIRAFRDTLIEAVKTRTGSEAQISAHLSGGLDSSSVSSIARNILQPQGKKLFATHISSDAPRSSEQHYAKMVSDTGGIELGFTTPDDFFETEERFAEIVGRPDHFTMHGGYFTAMAAWSQQQGCDVLLTGYEGDIVVGYGLDLLMEAAREGQRQAFEKRLTDFVEVIEMEVVYPGWNTWSLKQKTAKMSAFYAFDALKQAALKGQFGKIFRLTGWFFDGGFSKRQFLNLMAKKIKSNLATSYRFRSDPTVLINKSWAEHISLKELIKQTAFADVKEKNLDEKQQLHLKKMGCAGLVETLEQIYHLYAYFGIEARHPFQDRRLIELSLVVPDSLRFDRGRLRGILRYAMKDILPEAVRNRTRKSEFSKHIVDEAVAMLPALRRYCFERRHLLEKYISFDAFEKNYVLIQDTRQDLFARAAYVYHLRRVASLAAWLQTFSE